MARTATGNLSEIQSGAGVTQDEDVSGRVYIRVAPNSYLIASFLATFFSGLFVYLEFDLIAVALIFLGWIVTPLLLWFDRVVFDGEKLRRTGLVPRIWALFNKSPVQLSLDEVEQVETQSIRALKRGGSVFYRYRTTILGGNAKFVFASGGEKYRRMIRSILPQLSENLLDNRSIELRDYLSEPKETLLKAEFAKIPSTEVLEEAVLDFEQLRREHRSKPDFGDEEIEKADYLRTLANELRLSGYLLQSLEAFRRALFLNPRNGWLLFEFGRCLHSFAGAEGNERLEKRAHAILRLAERRANGDTELLARVGESYFQYGDWTRAAKVFGKTLAIAEHSFRSARGMAEIALREGKIAHVIHHFVNANRVAETPALRRWANTEVAYFTLLNSDEEYLESELHRVSLLESMESAKATSLKIALMGLPAIIVGVVSDIELLINVGWAVSGVALLIWSGVLISRNLLSERISPEA